MTLHNLHHYMRLMRSMRTAISDGTFAELLADDGHGRPNCASDDAGEGLRA